MTEPDAIAEFALGCSRDALDRLTAFVRTETHSADSAYEAEVRLAESRDDANGLRYNANEIRVAIGLLAGAVSTVYPYSEQGDEGQVDFDTGYELLQQGDTQGALAIADALIAEAHRTPATDWNHGNLIHHGHVLRGKVLLAQGDVAGSACELVAAGQTSGSPQLDTFGPDLTLAWELLKRSESQAVLTYLTSVAKFWSPHDRSSIRLSE